MSLVITLYQKCLLTNDYKEGFNMRISGNIDTYLATLTHNSIYTGDDIYFTNNGSISIENTGLTSFNANLYNYMTFSSTSNGTISTRYCFIKSITLVNEVAVIDYEEDLWSNYSSSMVLRYGFLSNAKRTSLSGYETFLPKDYNTNQPLTLGTITGGTAKKCYVVIDVNFYNLNQDGLATNRLFYSILLGKRSVQVDSSQQEIGTPTYSYVWDCDDDLMRILCQVKARTGIDAVAHTIHYGDTDITYDPANPYYFEITRAIIIPYDVGYGLFYTNVLSGDLLRKTMDDYFIFNSIGYPLSAVNTLTKTTPIMYTLSIIGGDKHNSYYGLEGNTPYTYKPSISNDYTIVGLQNNSRFISMQANGQSINIEWRFVCGLSGSSLLLNVNGDVTDITKDYEFNIPLNVQSADITQQAQISRNLSELNNGFNQLGTIWSGITGSAGNIKKDDTTGFIESYFGAMAKQEMNLINRESITARKSVSNKAVSSNDMSFFNASIPYGFYIAQITPTNSGDITAFINKFGYAYDNVLVTDGDVFDATAQDNYLRFADCVLYGGFSNEIAESLKQILKNGIYLFGTASV